MREAEASPRTFLGKFRSGLHRGFGDGEVWEGGKEDRERVRLSVLRTMWYPASQGTEKKEPQHLQRLGLCRWKAGLTGG